MKHYMLFMEETNQRVNFWDCWVDQNSANSCQFWKNKSVFLQSLHQSSVPWDITLLYYFSWNFILFWRKELIKVPNFRLSISPNLYLDKLLLLRVYKVSAKKVKKSYLSWHWGVMRRLKKNWLVVSSMKWGILWTFTQPLKSPKILLWWAIFV